jgi:hypothetical protein
MLPQRLVRAVPFRPLPLKLLPRLLRTASYGSAVTTAGFNIGKIPMLYAGQRGFLPLRRYFFGEDDSCTPSEAY